MDDRTIEVLDDVINVAGHRIGTYGDLEGEEGQGG